VEIALLSSEQEVAIKEDAMLDNEYTSLGKKVVQGENVDTNLMITDQVLIWKVRINAPQAMRKYVMKSEHDTNIARHFGRDRTL